MTYERVVTDLLVQAGREYGCNPLTHRKKILHILLDGSEFMIEWRKKYLKIHPKKDERKTFLISAMLGEFEA